MKVKRSQRMWEQIRSGQLTGPEEKENSQGPIFRMVFTYENLEGTPTQFPDEEV